MATFTPQQQSWRLCKDGAVEPVTFWANQDTTVTLDASTDVIRLRVCIIDTGGKAVNNIEIDLQYSTDDSSFTAFGAANHWDYYNGSGTEGNLVSGTPFIIDDSDTPGEFSESAGGSGTFDFGASEACEFDICFQQTANASDSTLYYFRVMINAAEVPLNGAHVHPNSTTAAAAPTPTVATPPTATLNLTTNTPSKTFGTTDTFSTRPNAENHRKHFAPTLNDSVQTDYQCKITVYKADGTDDATHGYLGTSVQDDFDDVRFTQGDGSTALYCWKEDGELSSGTSVPYWSKLAKVGSSLLTSDSGADNQIDVSDGTVFAQNDYVVIYCDNDPHGEVRQISSISTNTLTLDSNLDYNHTTANNAICAHVSYIYYEDAAIGDPSDGTNTFIQFDNFEWGNDGDGLDTDGWGNVNSAQIDTAQYFGGAKSALFPENGAGTTADRSLTATTGYAIRFRARISAVGVDSYMSHGDGSTMARLYVNGGSDELGSISYYDGSHNDTGTDIGGANGWYLFELNDFDWTANTYDIWYEGSEIQANASEWSNSGYTDLLQVGNADSAGGTSFWIDDFIVRKFVATEPVWAGWGYEETYQAASATQTIGVINLNIGELTASTDKMFPIPATELKLNSYAGYIDSGYPISSAILNLNAFTAYMERGQSVPTITLNTGIKTPSTGLGHYFSTATLNTNLYSQTPGFGYPISTAALYTTLTVPVITTTGGEEIILGTATLYLTNFVPQLGYQINNSATAQLNLNTFTPSLGYQQSSPTTSLYLTPIITSKGFGIYMPTADLNTNAFRSTLGYQIGFNPPLGLYEYYNTGDASANSIYGQSYSAQTFTPSSNHYNCRVKLKLYRQGAPPNLVVALRNTSSGIPAGSDLVSTTIPYTDVGISDTWVTVDFGSYTELSASTMYAIVCYITGDGGDISNKYLWKADTSSSTYTGGTYCSSTSGGSSWNSIATADFMFEEYGTTYLPTIPLKLTPKVPSLARQWLVPTSTLNLNFFTPQKTFGYPIPTLGLNTNTYRSILGYQIGPQEASQLKLTLNAHARNVHYYYTPTTIDLQTNLYTASYTIGIPVLVTVGGIALVLFPYAPHLYGGDFPITITGRYGEAPSTSWVDGLTYSGRYAEMPTTSWEGNVTYTGRYG